MPIRGNERSAVIELISEINTFVNTIDIRIKRAGGEATLFGNGQALFPDIILFGDEMRTQVLQGWEAKMPDVPITDVALIDNAKMKATLLGVNSFILWNFSAARLYLKNEVGVYSIIKSWNIPQIHTRNDVDIYEAEWKELLHSIVLELSPFFTNGTLRSSAMENILAENIGSSLLDRNKASVARALINASITNTVIDAWIKEWWLTAKIDYYKDETDPFNAYAKSLLIHWINRIIFAHLIKNYFNPATEVDSININTTPSQANAIFERITAACDFFNIFASCQYDDIISPNAWEDIIAINSFLSENNFALTQVSLQNILEHTVNVTKREIRGQFTTPTILADILVKITIHNLRGDFFDPCCGTGTIAKLAKEYKKSHLSVEETIASVWAEDKDAFPIQIAQLALSDIDAINLPVRLFKKDIFDLILNENINVVNPSNGQTLNLILPQFTSIASNLPFIAFENVTADEQAKINRVFSDVGEHSTLLDGRSDMYIPIVFALWKHLTNDGYLGIITSNSWLCTKAGQKFFCALQYYYFVEQVHTSGKGKWFSNAAVVTTILLLRKKAIVSEPLPDSNITFFLWHKDLDDLSNDNDIKQKLISASLQNRNVDDTVVSLRSYSLNEIEHLQDYNISKNALFHNVSWMNNIEGLLCPKHTIFKIFRGERRGWDKMFYPSSGHGIENQYIRPVLKNGRRINNLIAIPDGDAFCCNKTETELRVEGHNGAINWINRFQNEINGVGKPLSEVLSRANMFWYEMSDENTADLITTMNPDTRFFYAAFNTPTFINQRLIGLKFINENDHELCHALLNSMLEMFFTEACGFGRGLGVLDINSQNIGDGYMLNPAILDTAAKQTIIQAFQPIKTRTILNTEQELNMQDRIDFDHAILQAYGIDDNYSHIKNSLLSMQRTRHAVMN